MAPVAAVEKAILMTATAAGAATSASDR